MKTDSNLVEPDYKDLHNILSQYQLPSIPRSLWQVANSLIPYMLLWYLMYLSLEFSYWLTLALSILAAGFMMRTFIIFHDCGHGSFFKSRNANRFVGFITGILTFTPYDKWRHDHAIHHATAGNLDRRGTGDVMTRPWRNSRRCRGKTVDLQVHPPPAGYVYVRLFPGIHRFHRFYRPAREA
jgi:omega-6 fatty acid desaturase (delta-12 desaturase)